MTIPSLQSAALATLALVASLATGAAQTGYDHDVEAERARAERRETRALERRTTTAEELFEDFGYKASIPHYEAGDKLSLEQMERVATAYRLNHDPVNAERWYAQIVERSGKPEHLLYYAQALQSNGRPEQARRYFERYAAVAPDDERGGRAARDLATGLPHDERVVVRNERAVNTPHLDFSPSLRGPSEEVVFVSTRPVRRPGNDRRDRWMDDNFMSLFAAVRKHADRAALLERPTEFAPELNTPYHEGPLTFDRSGERVFFTRNTYNDGERRDDREGVMRLNIYQSYVDVDGRWSEPAGLPWNTDDYEEAHPALSDDGLALYFASDRPGGRGGMDLYVSRFVDGVWGAPQNLGPGINTTGNDAFPFVHADGTLYFASDGRGGAGGMDIYAVAEVERGLAAGTARVANVGTPYNGPMDDFGFALARDGRRGYFTSARPGGLGRDDIYSFVIGEPSRAGAPAPLALAPAAPQRVAPAPAVALLPAPMPTASARPAALPYPPSGPTRILAGTTRNTRYGNPVPGVELTLVDLCTGDELTAVADAEGRFNFGCVPCGCEFAVKGERQHFLPGETLASTLVDDCPEVGCEDGGEVTFELELTPSYGRTIEPEPEVYAAAPTYTPTPRAPRALGGGELRAGAVIELKNIYYDFDEAYIRDDARGDLDHLVALLEAYPGMEVELSSHTDARGRRAYNQTLSQARAENARAYLVRQGIDNRRVTAVGFGESQLRNVCADFVDCDERAHQLNRRTEVKVVRMGNAGVEVRYVGNEPARIDAADADRIFVWR